MSSALTHKTLVPGAVFPEIQLSKLDGSTIRTSFNTGRHTLIVVLRGIFCPICNLQTAEIAEKLDALQVSGIDVLIFSADSKEATAEHSKKSGNVLDSHFAYGLDSAQIKTLGLYESSPTGYIPQPQNFAEPAWFLLDPDNTIRYLAYGSAPLAGRVPIDKLLFVVDYVKKRNETDEEFRRVRWGSVAQE